MDTSRSHLKVLIAYGDPLVSVGLRTVISEHPGMVLVDDQADIVVADFTTGLKIASERRQHARAGRVPAVRVLIINPQDQEENVRSALNAGVEGYIDLGSQVHELIDAIRAVACGGRYLCTKASQRIADSLTRAAITARERQVLGLVATGCSNKDISADLAISLSTVKAHVKALLDKLGASSRTQATSIAVSRGLIAASSLPMAEARATSMFETPLRAPHRALLQADVAAFIRRASTREESTASGQAP